MRPSRSRSAVCVGGRSGRMFALAAHFGALEEEDAGEQKVASLVKACIVRKLKEDSLEFWKARDERLAVCTGAKRQSAELIYRTNA